MELIDSYLNEVGQFLPQETRHDILAELSDALEEELGDVAAARGVDAPETADAEVVLKRFGHPLKVASQYQPTRYLIGPDLYPVFLQTLRLLLSFTGVALVGIGLVFAMADGWQVGFWSLVDLSLSVVFWVFAITTAVFVAIEYSGEKLGWYDDWQPRRLASGSLGVIKRGDVITNLVTEGVFLLWWNDVLVLSNVISRDGSDFVFNLAGVWGDYFWPFNVLIGVCFLLHLHVLVKGVWQRSTLVLEIATNTALVALLLVLVVAPELVSVATGVPELLSDMVDRTLRIALLVIAGFAGWDLWLAWRHFKGAAWQRRV